MNRPSSPLDNDPVLAWLDESLNTLDDIWYNTFLRGPEAQAILKQRQQVMDNIADRVDFLVEA